MTNVKGTQNEEHVRPEEAIRENDPISIVSNLAEKAMSVAGPVVPTKDDGEVDQERCETFTSFLLVCFVSSGCVFLLITALTCDFVVHSKIGRHSSRTRTKGWTIEISW